MLSKPRHLEADYAAQFADTSIVEAYGTRPPYPEELFALLAELARHGRVLELGAGTGDVTFGLAAHVEHIDAVEPSAAMIAAAALRQQATNVRWLLNSAEAFTPNPPYALVVAAESLHWMEWSEVLPKIAASLQPQGVLAIVTERALLDLPWQRELRALIGRYSTNQDYRAYDIVTELAARELFHERGRRSIVSTFAQPLAQYIESFHSRNGFSRERMGEQAARFDAELRELVLSHRSDGIVSAPRRATVVWGNA